MKAPSAGAFWGLQKAGGKRSQQIGRCPGKLSSPCQAWALSLAMEQEFCRYLVGFSDADEAALSFPI